MSRSETIRMTVNGRAVSCDQGDAFTLADLIRDRLGLTGAHIGCDTGHCGACTVHFNGVAVKSCTIPAAEADGADITTIEGVGGANGALAPIQAAFCKAHALQCGFCTPGMIMSALDLLQRNPDPSAPDIKSALKGNLCRCTGYETIITAVRLAASGEDADADADNGCGVGARPRRREDPRFVTGRGRFVADITLPGQLHAVFVRSPHAHARILSIDTATAAVSAGVRAVFTGADVQRDGLGALRCEWRVASTDGAPMKGGERPLLALEKVRFEGDAIAVVIAETRAQAEAAAALVVARYGRLVANTDVVDATSSPQVHDDAVDNRCFRWSLGDEQAVVAAFASAAHIVETTVRNNRLAPNPIEPRAAVADYDPAGRQWTLYTTSQNPHMARRILARTVGVAKEHDIRVISPDVGGGFGSKIFVYPEECICLWAAGKLAAPVKWVATRSEAFRCDAHGRDQVAAAALALDDTGGFLGLKVRSTANLGAYLSTFAAFAPTFVFGSAMTGPYRTPAIHIAVDGVFTNTPPVDAYRGAGRPEAAFILETLIDKAAAALRMDPAALRRRNFIQPTDYPYQTPLALEYDSGDYEQHFAVALDLADYAGFPSRKAAAAARGRLRGIGLACFVEACGIAPSAVAAMLGAETGLWESATLRFTPTGGLHVLTGSHAQGQGHETTFAQIAADVFGMSLDDIRVIHGDTDKTPVGMGTYGSRSLTVGGAAIAKAAEKIIAKGKKIAAHRLAVSDDGVEFQDGAFYSPRGGPRYTIADIARIAYAVDDYPPDLEPGLEATAFHDPENFSYPSGTHVCEVEITPETGALEIVQYIAVDDFGEIVHPDIVDGQVRGGALQGIGQALLEQCLFTAEGALQTTGLDNYALPRIDHAPAFTLAKTKTPCTHNPLRAKGCGEAGAIAAPPAVMNAIFDAVGSQVEMPARPDRLWAAIRNREAAR